ncbi:hypothetical protein HPB47_006698 [Ixodes persulcatus]|uniref:Uncharacterized protein n=1 Tax=Ixodes persulcatus TaxID=34615 RepID=A0AC60P9N4_IXOPE|nr:hypothetical protein HPB47_006698 [Ixodes persulcatus]
MVTARKADVRKNAAAQRYQALFYQDQLVPGDFGVCPKLTVAHILPSQTDKMRDHPLHHASEQLLCCPEQMLPH